MKTGACGLDQNREFYSTVECRNKVNICTGRASEDTGFVRSLPGQPKEEKENFMDLIGEKKKEIYDKIKSGEIDGAIQIGGSIFTASEWDMIMKRIDATLEKGESPIKETIEEETEKKGQDKSMGQITEEMLDALFLDENKGSVTVSKNASGTNKEKEVSVEKRAMKEDGEEGQENRYFYFA